MEHNCMLPLVKWVGSKKRLLTTLEKLMPEHYDYYCEPFVGGGSLFFHIHPKKAWINDINQELMTLYRIIGTQLDEIKAVIDTFENTKECYMQVRAWDRDVEGYSKRSDAQKVARLLYLNHTCFNGLYRVNSKGFFNTPFGKYANPTILHMDRARAIIDYFADSEIKMTCLDFKEVLDSLTPGAFVYLDPPYMPLKDSSFTRYTSDNFMYSDHRQLLETCQSLDKRGIKFMLSNSMTETVIKLFANFSITEVKTTRFINANHKDRGKVSEVVIRNYF